MGTNQLILDGRTITWTAATTTSTGLISRTNPLHAKLFFESMLAVIHLAASKIMQVQFRPSHCSSGASCATSTATDGRPRRPARPACCHTDATVGGTPTWIVTSRSPISMPSSSALVATTPRVDAAADCDGGLPCVSSGLQCYKRASLIQCNTPVHPRSCQASH